MYCVSTQYTNNFRRYYNTIHCPSWSYHSLLMVHSVWGCIDQQKLPLPRRNRHIQHERVFEIFRVLGLSAKSTVAVGNASICTKNRLFVTISYLNFGIKLDTCCTNKCSSKKPFHFFYALVLQFFVSSSRFKRIIAYFRSLIITT